MWAITNFTEENGATRIIPGSHLRDAAPNPLEHYETIPAEMPKGSVLVWVGSSGTVAVRIGLTRAVWVSP